MSEFLHANLSPWGYIYDAETLPNFLNAAEFGAFTNGKFDLDTRINANIPAATEAIRNYCGWHVSPNLTCGMIYNVRDLRDAFTGPDLLVQLPATFVTSIDKIILNAVMNQQTGEYEGDDKTDDYDLGGDGLLRIYDVGFLDRKSKIFIKYTAGFPDNQIQAIKELTAHRVTHAVTSSYGVMSEAAGGVSISYNASWAGNTRSTALPDDNREVLNPYKVKGVF